MPKIETPLRPVLETSYPSPFSLTSSGQGLVALSNYAQSLKWSKS